MPTIKQLLSLGIETLSKNKMDNPYLDARLLMQHALQCSLESLLTRQETIATPELEKSFNQLISQRAQMTPVAYLTGKKEFFGLDFEVTDDVLIPRSDSEILIEAVLAEFGAVEPLKILDLGTGSGCLAITLLHNLTSAEAVAIDINQSALNVAKKNALKHNVTNRIEFVKSNWFESLSLQKFNIIIANPPYIATEEKFYMSAETLHEPPTALFAENRGLAAYQEIAKHAVKYLAGSIYLEIGFQQKLSVTKIFEAQNLMLQNVYQDLQGHDRCLKFNLQEE
jgi:release factor glutamine methyltransferase